MKPALDIVIPLLAIVACWCFGAAFVVPFYLTLIALAVAVIWRGYYSYTEPRDPVELDCGFGDTVFGRPEPVHTSLVVMDGGELTVLDGGGKRAVWPNEIGGIE